MDGRRNGRASNQSSRQETSGLLPAWRSSGGAGLLFARDRETFHELLLRSYHRVLLALFLLLVPFLLSSSSSFASFSRARLAARRRMLHHGATSLYDPPRHMAVTHTQTPPRMGIVASLAHSRLRRVPVSGEGTIHRAYIMKERERERDWEKGEGSSGPYAALIYSSEKHTRAHLCTGSGLRALPRPSSAFTTRVGSFGRKFA